MKMILKRSVVTKEKYDVELDNNKRYVFMISHHKGYDGNFIREKLWTDDGERIYEKDFPKVFNAVQELVTAYIDKNNGN
jgi:hypothetical protein